jgi:hypothetical protein
MRVSWWVVLLVVPLGELVHGVLHDLAAECPKLVQVSHDAPCHHQSTLVMTMMMKRMVMMMMTMMMMMMTSTVTSVDNDAASASDAAAAAVGVGLGHGDADDDDDDHEDEDELRMKRVMTLTLLLLLQGPRGAAVVHQYPGGGRAAGAGLLRADHARARHQERRPKQELTLHDEQPIHGEEPHKLRLSRLRDSDT